MAGWRRPPDVALFHFAKRSKGSQHRHGAERCGADVAAIREPADRGLYVRGSDRAVRGSVKWGAWGLSMEDGDFKVGSVQSEDSDVCRRACLQGEFTLI